MTVARCTPRIDRSRRDRDRAFTLVELVVVLVVISVMAGLALPAYSSAVARYRLQSAAHNLASDIDHATQYAAATMTEVTVQFNTVNNRVRFGGLPARHTVGPSHVLDLEEHPNGAAISSVDFSGLQQYTISAFGVPSSGGTVVLRNGDGAVTLEVDVTTGTVSMTP